MATKPAYKFPKTIGACADRIYKLREERYAAQKVVTKIEAEEDALREHIINTLPKSETSGVAGKLARVVVKTKKIPQAKDWALVWKHIKKTGDFDLLQKRLSAEAVQERWDAGKKVPGVESFNAVSLSITKV